VKKNYFWILIVIVIFALSGLILFQSYWIVSAFKIKESQFNQRVNNALNNIVKSLQQEETVSFLKNEVNTLFEDSISIKRPSNSIHFSKEFQGNSYKNNAQYKARIGVVPDDSLSGQNNEISLNKLLSKLSGNSNDTSAEDRKNAYSRAIYYKSRIVENIVNKLIKSHLRIEERIDNEKLALIIRADLILEGIKIPYEYAVKDDGGNVIYKSTGYNDTIARNYVARLFPDDIFDQPNFLVLQFPGRDTYIFHSMGLMVISSIALTAIIILTLAFVIVYVLKQKKLSEIKTDFISNMTHELKTPISTISLASQMLNDTSIPDEAKNIGHLSKLILDESKRLGLHVEKVLQMAVFEKAHIKLKPKKLNANELIANILNNFNLQLKNHNGKIFKELNAEYPFIMADEMHFTNVILNLLDNALKYRKDDPVIMVATRNSANGLIIEVKDNGIGISKENQKKIFDQFYRVPTGNVHNVKGFGLGLSYVKKISEAHGGNVSIESKPDHGSTFSIFIPTN
jgi:two-component system phosphate regulon sensor histidine kinase PhoR